jgi:hypothetical protein
MSGHDACPAAQRVEPTAPDAVRKRGGEWPQIAGLCLQSVRRDTVLDADDEPRELVVAAERAAEARTEFKEGRASANSVLEGDANRPDEVILGHRIRSHRYLITGTHNQVDRTR